MAGFWVNIGPQLTYRTEQRLDVLTGRACILARGSSRVGWYRFSPLPLVERCDHVREHLGLGDRRDY